MARLIWTQPAADDLREIERWIARDSRTYARQTGRRIRRAATRLKAFPESGRIVPERSDPTYREVIVGQYRLLYRYLPDRGLVAVLAVVEGHRLLPPLHDDG